MKIPDEKCPTKKCSRCGEDKYITEFYKHPNTPDHLMYWCKGCMATYQSMRKSSLPDKYREKNRIILTEEEKKERQKESAREWKKRNPEKVAEQNKQYREQHPEEVKEYQKEYYVRNKERLQEYKRGQYLKSITEKLNRLRESVD